MDRGQETHPRHRARQVGCQPKGIELRNYPGANSGHYSMTQDKEPGHKTRKNFSPGSEASTRGTVEETRVLSQG